jgi:hypothetical protein
MLIRSDLMNYGVEFGADTSWLPRLRNEGLLKLGGEFSNWLFDAPSEKGQLFWSMFYGDRDAVRQRIAGLLGCYAHATTRRIRYHSQADVECLTSTQYELGLYDDRVPRFTIDAHELAERVQAICGTPLFTARAAVLA